MSVKKPFTSRELERLLEKIAEFGHLQLVDRRILRYSGDREESTAEHSWELAMFAWLLLPYYEEKLDEAKVIKLALIHDIIEVYAGDTYAFDYEHRKTKHTREDEAWKKLFDRSVRIEKDMSDLWREYALRQSKEAHYVAGLDKLIPMVHRVINNDQHVWSRMVSENEIRQSKEPQLKHSRLFTELFELLLARMDDMGYFDEATYNKRIRRKK